MSGTAVGATSTFVKPGDAAEPTGKKSTKIVNTPNGESTKAPAPEKAMPLNTHLRDKKIDILPDLFKGSLASVGKLADDGYYTFHA